VIAGKSCSKAWFSDTRLDIVNKRGIEEGFQVSVFRFQHQKSSPETRHFFRKLFEFNASYSPTLEGFEPESTESSARIA
jgi:hypothetical protein